MRGQRAGDLAWSALPRAARAYVAFVIGGGAVVFGTMFPLALPRPLLFAAVLAATCLTASWKVNLPIPLASGSTLAVSSASMLMALLLLGPRHAVVIAVAGALTQCTYRARQPYPVYRTVFSMASKAIAMTATGLVYVTLGGTTGPFEIAALARPLVVTIATYFVLDTGLVAAAIALSTGRRLADVWRQDFLLGGVTFMLAGTAGAAAAVIVEHGYHWIAVLLLAPLYVTYRTYLAVMARLEGQQRHMAEMSRLHQETMEARASAERANRLKDQFLAVVSHELRTPLNAILGWSDMLRSGRLDEPRRERAFAAIHDSATRQAQLIDELLDVARIMSGKLRLERTFVDVEHVVRGAVNVVQPSAEAKRIQVTLDVDPALGVIYADRSRLQQIVWNLLSNAIKFTPEGGSVGVWLSRDGDTIEMTVTDTGEGIAADSLATIFEAFRQADGSTTRRHGGLGLGLSIVRHLVEAHGGVVAAQSDGAGQGATFVVRLPVAPASAEQAQIAMADRPASAMRWTDPELLDGLRVLVVDDDDDGREVVAAQLERHRAFVLTARSAAEALELLQRERVDVLLADIAMPGMDGYTLIRQLRALPSAAATVPAAALTAFARTEDRAQALQAGYQMHLVKPIDGHSLVTAVARLAGSASATV